MATADEKQHEDSYREFFRDEKGLIITLGDFFDAVNETPEVKAGVEEILSKDEAVTILIEGSAFIRNIDVVDKALSARSNTEDKIILIDISKQAIAEHNTYLQEHFPNKKYYVVAGNMNTVPLVDGSVDLVINDCAINFNETDSQNIKTVAETKRILKPGKSGILLSVAVDRTYDRSEFGTDQENVPADKISQPGFFYPLPDHRFTRTNWTVPYYRSLFATNDLEYKEFDIEKGKIYFPEESGISYRRFFLRKE
jgi:hypothetical protein